MITFCDLERETKVFFDLYWKQEYGQRPSWSGHWVFEGTIPQNDKRGCYALFTGYDIIYIGIGIGRSTDFYRGAGLGDRLKNYWRVNKNNPGKNYQPRDNWKEVTSIITIGFGEDHFPLAAALKVYLIGKLNPRRNSKHKSVA